MRRVYDRPQTPLERVLASPERDPGKVAHLQALRERLDPFALAEAIDEKLERLYALAHPRPRPQPQARPPALSAVERKSLQAVSEIFGIPCVVGSGRSTGSRGK